MSDYARRIRAARGYAGMTQRELADALGVDEQTVKRREAGSQDPKKGELIAIASVCGVPLEFMESWFLLTRDEIAERLEELQALVAGYSGQAEGALRDVSRTITQGLAGRLDNASPGLPTDDGTHGPADATPEERPTRSAETP